MIHEVYHDDHIKSSNTSYGDQEVYHDIKKALNVAYASSVPTREFRAVYIGK